MYPKINEKMIKRFSDAPRTKKKPKIDEVKAGPKKVVGPVCHEYTFMEDEEGLYAMVGNDRIPLSIYSRNVKNVSAGETWMCMMDGTEPSEGISLMAVSMVSKADAEKVEESVEGGIAEDVSEGSPEVSTIDNEEVQMSDDQHDAIVAGLKETVEALKARVETYKTRADRYDQICRESESKDETIRQLKRKVDSLSTQVKALNNKDSVKNAQSRESEIGALNDKVESQELEIRMLREKLKSMDIDDLEVVPRLPKVHKAHLMGEETVQCTMFTEGRYSVYVNPRLRSIRVVPDDNGKVTCRNDTLRLRCISGFSQFEKVRPLRMVPDDEGITIQL